jgi:hypothetical protein
MHARLTRANAGINKNLRRVSFRRINSKEMERQSEREKFPYHFKQARRDKAAGSTNVKILE